MQVPTNKTYRAAATAFKGLFTLMGGITASGTEHLPSDGPFILAPDHNSFYDIPAIGVAMLEAQNTTTHFVAKRNVISNAVARTTGFERLLLGFGGIPIDTRRPLPKATRAHIGDIFDQNGVLCIYPEGTLLGPVAIEKDNLHAGVAHLAIKNNVQIVPASIKGTLKRDRWPIHVAFEEPIEAPGDMPIKPARRHIMEQLALGMQAAQQTARQHVEDARREIADHLVNNAASLGRHI